MFKIKDSGTVDIDSCKTNHETMVDADNVDRINAKNCTAGPAPEAEIETNISKPKAFFKKVLDKVVDHALGLIVAAFLTAVCAYIGFG